MPKKKKDKPQQGDFRYSVGEARVPWHAVGEFFDAGDVVEVVKFLMPPKRGAAHYGQRLREVGKTVRALAKESGQATKLTLGSRVEKAEADMAKFLKVKHACLLTNWTAGMEIACKLAGVGPGDEVILPTITFAATMLPPLALGAKVVFADVEPDTINMDSRDVARKITKKTRVILPVHMGGYPCDMDPIMRLARKHDLYVIEDAAHGFGAKYKGKYLGTIGHFGGYSLHEVKNINSFGEGGLLVSNLDLGKQFKKARFCGLDFTRAIPRWLYDATALFDRYGRPQVPGNHSATEFQGLGLSLQAGRFRKILAARKAAFDYLNDAFRNEPGILLPRPDTKTIRSSHHLYLLRIDPDVVGADIHALKAKLKEKSVTELQHFGPLYKFELLRQFGYNTKAIARSCPNTEEVFGRRYTHLPLYPLTRAQLRYMAKAVVDSVRELRAAERS